MGPPAELWCARRRTAAAPKRWKRWLLFGTNWQPLHRYVELVAVTFEEKLLCDKPCTSGAAGGQAGRRVSGCEDPAGLLSGHAAARLLLVQSSPPIMHDAIAIHGHDIIDLVAAYPDGIRLSQLMEIVGERYGRSVTFHTCSAMGMDLDGLLSFLEAEDKVGITSGVVYPGGSPACEH